MTVVDQEISAPRAGLTGFTLALNYLPITQLLLGSAGIWALSDSLASMILFLIAWVFLLPPLACRLAFSWFGAPHGIDLTQDSRAYKVWWFSHQWQAVFNRLPWIEEILRLAPGLYSVWINLWGGRASAMVYWSPGCIVIDRPLIIVEPFAVIGGHAGLTGHLGRIGGDGHYLVDIAAPRVGRGAIVGAGAALGPGAELPPGQLLPAGKILPPFTRWAGASKQRPISLRAANADG
jgi:hypothetical protein